MAATLLGPVAGAGAVPGVTVFGGSGTGPGQMLTPLDVAVAPNGDVLVPEADPAAPRVQRFSAAGAYLSQFGTVGAANERLTEAERVAVAPGGQIFVADNGVVKRYSAAGAYETAYGGGTVGDLAVGPTGLLYVTDLGGPMVHVYDWSGKEVDSWGGYGTEPGQFRSPQDIALDASGRVFVSDAVNEFAVPNSRIQVFDSDGDFLQEWKPILPGESLGTAPTLALGPGGDVYLINGLVMARFTPAGQFVSSLPLPFDVPGYPYVYYSQIGAGGYNIYAAIAGGRRVLRVEAGMPQVAVSAPAQVLTGTPVAFDVSATTVPLGRIVGYEWDLDGDGNFELDTGMSPTASRSYPTRGPVAVGVRVRSDVGGVATVTHALAVRPTPPPGPVGVSIENGAQYVNDPKVKVTVRWPRYASDLLISNDGGFFPYEQTQVAETIAWKLRASGPERLPKTIYVRFQGGEAGPETYQDDIILDQTAPVLKSVTPEPNDGSGARVARAGRKGATLKVVASDRTSGVRKMQVSSRKAKPGRWKPFRARVKAGPGRVFVRVRDGAGNASRWRSAVVQG